MRTALEILEDFTPKDDVPIRNAIGQLEAFIAAIKRRHKAQTGEAYPEDRNHYCAVCMSANGGSSRWPCGTIKAIRKYLKPGGEG